MVKKLFNVFCVVFVTYPFPPCRLPATEGYCPRGIRNWTCTAAADAGTQSTRAPEAAASNGPRRRPRRRPVKAHVSERGEGKDEPKKTNANEKRVTKLWMRGESESMMLL
jgi:hypothetical protein